MQIRCQCGAEMVLVNSRNGALLDPKSARSNVATSWEGLAAPKCRSHTVVQLGEDYHLTRISSKAAMLHRRTTCMGTEDLCPAHVSLCELGDRIAQLFPMVNEGPVHVVDTEFFLLI